MKGWSHLYPVEGEIEAAEWTHPPELAVLQKAVEGDIQLVPHFDFYTPPGGMIEYRCIAFCNEKGKVIEMPINLRATEAWHFACLRSIGRPLILADGRALDVLVGPMIVVWGNREFLKRF